jgi:cytoskeletal protein RodZ
MEDEQLIPVEVETIEPEPQPSKAKRPDWSKAMLGLIIALLVAVIAVQFVQLQRTSSLADEIVALESDVTDLKPLRRDVDLISDQVAALDDEVTAAVQSSTPAALATALGSLARGFMKARRGQPPSSPDATPGNTPPPSGGDTPSTPSGNSTS